jgi:uncharacterized membrane protein YgcG
MLKQGSLSGYLRPEVVDHGTLVEMTASAHVLLGQATASDLSFSSPHTPGGALDPGVGTTGGATQTPSSGTSPGGGSSGGSPGGGTSGGGSSGGGGQLPFTGLAAGAVGLAGAALTASGGALRRVLRRGQG